MHGVARQALDLSGLTYLWSKIKEEIVNTINNSASGKVIIPVNPTTEPQDNGAIWITTN